MTTLRSLAVSTVIVIMAGAATGARQDATLLDRADAVLRAADFAGARPLYEQALKSARDAGTESDIARALLGLARFAVKNRRSADGRDAAAEALAIVERLEDRSRIAQASNLMATIERAAGNSEAAARHANRALAIADADGNHAASAEAAYHLAQLTADVDEQGRWFLRAAASAGAAGDTDREGVALHAYGDRLFNAGRYEESLALLTRAAAVFEAAKAHEDLGTVYNSIGRVYRAHGRYDEALRYQNAALDLHRKGDDVFALVQSLNAVSSVHLRMGNYTASRAFLEEAMAVAAAQPPSPVLARAVDFLRANMAGLLVETGDMAPAARTIEQVIADGRDAFKSLRYGHLSTAYIGLGRYADAVDAAERSVALCGDAKVDCILAHNRLSDAFAARGDRDAALAELSLTLRGIEEQRAQLVPADFFKQDFSSHYRRAYGSAIAMQLDAGLARDALETGELARSRALLDLLASRSIAPANTPAAPVLPLTLRGGGSGAASPAVMAPSTSSGLIRTAARLRSTLVVYWVSDAETVIWVVSPGDRVDARRVKVTRSRLSTLVRDTAPFTNAAAATPVVLRQSTAAWRELYALLIAPVKALLPKRNGDLLTIVPHDALTDLSFAALQDANGRYLLEDYTLHYAPAGALLEFTAERRQQQPRAGSMLMVADPDPARRSTLDPPLPRLPGARREGQAITRQLDARRVSFLNGVAATEAAVREQAPQRSILHFAAHTVVRDDDPFASYLALTRTGSGNAADGVLTAQEVYGLKLAADLVVLSSCRSASGTVAGDGVATFARAFLSAGVSSLVASAWEVADQPAERMLPEFYRAWFGGAAKAAALRDAQLGLLRELRAGRVRVTTAIGPVPLPEHPVFWAGFILYGEPD